MVNLDSKIIIVGAGPAGVSTWLHLYKQNQALAMDTIVIDKESFPREKVCTGGLTPYVDLVLSQLDINIDISAVPIHFLEFRFKKQIFICHQQDAFKVIQRHEFDYSLVK